MNVEEHLARVVAFAEGEHSWWNAHAPSSGEPGLFSQAEANCSIHNAMSALMHLMAALALEMESDRVNTEVSEIREKRSHRLDRIFEALSSGGFSMLNGSDKS